MAKYMNSFKKKSKTILKYFYEEFFDDIRTNRRMILKNMILKGFVVFFISFLKGGLALAILKALGVEILSVVMDLFSIKDYKNTPIKEFDLKKDFKHVLKSATMGALIGIILGKLFFGVGNLTLVLLYFTIFALQKIYFMQLRTGEWYAQKEGLRREAEKQKAFSKEIENLSDSLVRVITSVLRQTQINEKIIDRKICSLAKKFEKNIKSDDQFAIFIEGTKENKELMLKFNEKLKDIEVCKEPEVVIKQIYIEICNIRKVEGNKERISNDIMKEDILNKKENIDNKVAGLLNWC